MDRRLTRRSFISAAALTGLGMSLDWGLMNALAAGIQPKRDYPVVVIGAGLGGLCCGALLARQGFPVTLVEQHDVPGGYATAFERGGGRFTFDVSLHRLWLNNDIRELLRELGVLGKIELVKIPNATRVITPGHDIRAAAPPERYAAELLARFPHEARGIKDYFAEIRAVHHELEALRSNPRPHDFPAQYPGLWNMRNKNLAAFVNGFVKDPAVQESLTARWPSFGLPPSKLSAFLYVVGSGPRNKGYSYVKARSRNLSQTLADAILQAGGRIHYGTPASNILVKDKAVSGVVTAAGEQLPARIVVSNASAPATLKRMLPSGALPAAYLERINGFKPSISTFIVWLGLNRELHRTVKENRIVLASGRGAEAEFKSCLRGEVDKVSCSVILYDNYYQGYSRPGTSSLTIITMSGYEPWRRFESNYRVGRKSAYNLEKERWAGALIRKVEQKAIPGLSSMVEVKEAATPLTNQRYTGNPEGAIYGFEQSVDNSFPNRIKNRVPVKGLYLAGAWGTPGGGYTGALRGGQRTFGQIMEDWG